MTNKKNSINFRTCTFSADASIFTSFYFVTKESNQFVLRLVQSMRSTLDSTCLSVQVERIELVSSSSLCQTYYEETSSVQSIMWTTSTTKAVEVRMSEDVLAKNGITSLWKRDACCLWPIQQQKKNNVKCWLLVHSKICKWKSTFIQVPFGKYDFWTFSPDIKIQKWGPLDPIWKSAEAVCKL